jgi:hypothetical protein
MTDAETLQLSAIYRRLINDLEQKSGVRLSASDYDAAVKLVEEGFTEAVPLILAAYEREKK